MMKIFTCSKNINLNLWQSHTIFKNKSYLFSDTWTWNYIIFSFQMLCSFCVFGQMHPLFEIIWFRNEWNIYIYDFFLSTTVTRIFPVWIVLKCVQIVCKDLSAHVFPKNPVSRWSCWYFPGKTEDWTAITSSRSHKKCEWVRNQNPVPVTLAWGVEWSTLSPLYHFEQNARRKALIQTALSSKRAGFCQRLWWCCIKQESWLSSLLSVFDSKMMC